MSRLRVFVSSTHYDLKHLRSALEHFITALGFEAVLSEVGNIAYAADITPAESCYREAGSADIFVLIIGGRYGSAAPLEDTNLATQVDELPGFYRQYESITSREYRAAYECGVPSYVFIDRAVFAEYKTFMKNRENTTIAYAHVYSVNIFNFIHSIVTQPRNNPIFEFDRYGDIEKWLREQWSGLFRELLRRMQAQAQLASLQAQVAQLAEIGTTMKTYLETVVARVAPAESNELIATETRRLEQAITNIATTSRAATYLRGLGLTLDYFVTAPDDTEQEELAEHGHQTVVAAKRAVTSVLNGVKSWLRQSPGKDEPKQLEE